MPTRILERLRFAVDQYSHEHQLDTTWTHEGDTLVVTMSDGLVVQILASRPAPDPVLSDTCADCGHPASGPGAGCPLTGGPATCPFHTAPTPAIDHRIHGRDNQSTGPDGPGTG